MIFEQEAKIYKDRAIQDALDDVFANATQYTWHTETDTGAGSGTHITLIPQDQFLDDPDNGGFNVLINSLGTYIRNGLTTTAFYGASTRVGETNGARVEIDPDEVSMLTEDGVQAVSIKSSVQAEPQDVNKNLSIAIAKNTTDTVTISDLSDAIGTFKFSYTYRYYNNGWAQGAYKSVIGYFTFTKGTSETKTITYTENAGTSVTRTITIDYDGSEDFTISNPSPYFNFNLTNIKYTSQSAPTPETQFNGFFYLNGVDLEHPVLDTTVLTPYSNRCTILGGGLFRFGKWRFIQVNVDIETNLSANNTWAILEGLANDLPVTNGRNADATLGKMTAISACTTQAYGNISAYISNAGRIVIATASQPLAIANVVTINGWYIAQ